VQSLYVQLSTLIDTYASFELKRKANMRALKEEFYALGLDQKVPYFEAIFEYSAINILGISLDENSFGEVAQNKYIQLLAILPKAKSAPKKHNVSLGYYGKGALLDVELKAHIVAFVLRWRFEKGFLALQKYDETVERYLDTHDQ